MMGWVWSFSYGDCSNMLNSMRSTLRRRWDISRRYPAAFTIAIPLRKFKILNKIVMLVMDFWVGINKCTLWHTFNIVGKLVWIHWGGFTLLLFGDFKLAETWKTTRLLFINTTLLLASVRCTSKEGKQSKQQLCTLIARSSVKYDSRPDTFL